MIATKALSQCSKTGAWPSTFLCCYVYVYCLHLRWNHSPPLAVLAPRTLDKNHDSLFFMGKVIVPFTISFTRGPMKINRQCNPAFPLDSHGCWQWECRIWLITMCSNAWSLAVRGVWVQSVWRCAAGLLRWTSWLFFRQWLGVSYFFMAWYFVNWLVSFIWSHCIALAGIIVQVPEA